MAQKDEFQELFEKLKNIEKHPQEALQKQENSGSAPEQGRGVLDGKCV